MSIELDIKITSPLTPDDRDLLSGVAVMVLAATPLGGFPVHSGTSP